MDFFCFDCERSLCLSHFIDFKEWWLGRESNPRHEDFQSSALPTELPSHLRGETSYADPSRLTSWMPENLPFLSNTDDLSEALQNRTFTDAASGLPR